MRAGLMTDGLSRRARYGVALASALAAVAARWLLNPTVGDDAHFAFQYLAVMLAAAAGGLGPALLATLIGAAAVAWLWMPPVYSLAVREPDDLRTLMLFVIVSMGIAWVGARLRQAEAAASRSQRELQDFFDNASLGMHWVGPEGLIQTANKAELAMLGYRREEYVGRHIAEFHVDRAVIDDILQRLHAGEVIESRPSRMRCKDGSIRDVLIDSSALCENGRFVHTRCFTRDITRRTVAEQALRRSEERLQMALLAGHMGTWEWDIASDKVQWSAGLERIHGLAPGAFDGTFEAFQRDIHPDDRQRVLEAIERAVRDGSEHAIEYRVVRADGSLAWVEGRGVLMRDQAGQAQRMVGVCMDVTQRKRAEEAIHESERRFARFTQHLPGLAWIKDLQGRYVYVNDAVAAAFGRAREDVTGRADRDIFPPEVAKQFRDNDRKAIESGGIETIESLGQPDGLVHHSLVKKFVIPGPDGAPAYIGGIAIDISDRLRMEQALRDSDRRKDEFLAILAHELRNPLAPIHAATQVMRAVGMDDPQLRWARDVIERQARVMSRLVDDLMDVSRITRGKVELRKQRLNLAEVIARAMETARPLLEARRHSVQAHMPPQPLFLLADPTRLEQVFANLLNNAAKYTPECGRIDVQARSDGHDAVISLRDNGIGIDAESLPLVFDMFVQSGGDRSSARGGLGGLGIGLSLVRTLVRMHGGSVEARSAGRGKGSEFIVRLPRLIDATSDDREEASRPPASSEIALKAGPTTQPLRQRARHDVSAETTAAQPAHDSARRRILVVDDNHDVAETLAAFLRLEEHVVAVAHDASTALELFGRERPDIVFLDIGLPEIDGCEVARRMRAAEADARAADPGAAPARLIALTGWGQPEDYRRSIEAGFDDHLVKPIEPEVLLAIVSEASAAPARPAVITVATESSIAPAPGHLMA